MAKQTEKPEIIVREYVIPLRNEWRKVASYRRAGKAARFIKKFIARHMKVAERDTDKVKLDMYLNQEVWFRGKTKPPAKIKVRAIKEGEIVKVELVTMPTELKFLKQKHDKRHKPAEKSKEVPKEEKKEEKSVEEKKDEKEKEQASAIQKEAQLESQAKVQKHVLKDSKIPTRRLALKK